MSAIFNQSNSTLTNNTFYFSILLTNSSNDVNLTTPSEVSQCNITPFSCFLVVCYLIVFIVGVGGNALVIFIFAPSFQKGPIIELLILYLAFFDLLSSIFGPLVFVYWIMTCSRSWYFGTFGCKVLPSLSRIFTDISIGIILMMTIDRCRAIVTPFKKRFSRRTIHLCVVLTTILSFLCEYYYFNALFIDENGLCMVASVDDPKYSYPLVILTMLRDIVFVVIFSVSTVLVYTRLNQSSDMSLLRAPQSLQVQFDRRKRVMKMLVVMGIIFTLAVIPRDILHLAYTISWMKSDGISHTTLLTLSNNLLKVLQVSNSIYNVFIYGKMHAHFWSNLKILILCKKEQRLYTLRTARLMNTSGRTHRVRRLTESSIVTKTTDSINRDYKKVLYKTDCNSESETSKEEIVFE